MKKTTSTGKKIWTAVAYIAAFGAGVLCERLGFFAFLSESWEDVLYFLWQHIKLVFVGSMFAILIGVPIGILLTRSFMKPFRKVMLALLGILQTIPSLAVLAMVMTWVGIGAKTAIIGLLVYSLLPIIRNTVAGIDNINPTLIDAARGMGMTPV
ncbi:MAG: ABC transporter permease subunit, partial [Desulfobacterales bacterium]|nr:ABC transporter permease subunit [Desulfobacterales bacterium]